MRCAPSPPRRLRRRSRSGGGYTLVELLVGATLGTLVLGALAGAVLVSEMRVSVGIRRELERRDALNRAVALMRSEISAATKISIGSIISTGNALDLCVGGTLQLVVVGKNICYKPLTFPATSTTTVLNDASAYGQASDRPWIGSCLVVRQGPPYRANGDLDINSTSTVRQVVLDDLSGSCSTGSTGAFALRLTGGSNALRISRDIDITLRQGGGVVTSFSARSGSNPLYSGNDMANMTTGCSATERVCRWKPSFGQAAPAASGMYPNVYYFDRQ